MNFSLLVDWIPINVLVEYCSSPKVWQVTILWSHDNFPCPEHHQLRGWCAKKNVQGFPQLSSARFLVATWISQFEAWIEPPSGLSGWYPRWLVAKKYTLLKATNTRLRKCFLATHPTSETVAFESTNDCSSLVSFPILYTQNPPSLWSTMALKTQWLSAPASNSWWNFAEWHQKNPKEIPSHIGWSIHFPPDEEWWSLVVSPTQHFNFTQISVGCILPWSRPVKSKSIAKSQLDPPLLPSCLDNFDEYFIPYFDD